MPLLTSNVMCRKGYSLIPFKCSNCGYRTPYDKKSDVWYPYLHYGTNKKTGFVAKCISCGKKSKLKGLIWLLIGGATVGAVPSLIINNGGSIKMFLYSTPLFIILSIAFIVTLAFYTIRWIPYDK